MKSVLKWVGAKHNIMASLKHVLPKGGRLIEPFGGSGAVMMNTNYPEYILADINSDLIDTYQSIFKSPEKVLSELKRLYCLGRSEDAYYELRSQFNNHDSASDTQAALFIYLNRFGHRGLCRYNRKGIFNVPRVITPTPISQRQSYTQWLRKCPQQLYFAPASRPRYQWPARVMWCIATHHMLIPADSRLTMPAVLHPLCRLSLPNCSSCCLNAGFMSSHHATMRLIFVSFIKPSLFMV